MISPAVWNSLAREIRTNIEIFRHEGDVAFRARILPGEWFRHVTAVHEAGFRAQARIPSAFSSSGLLSMGVPVKSPHYVLTIVLLPGKIPGSHGNHC